jgi:plastocyanin domain-containing protein
MADFIVIILGLAAIAWVNWYFFFAQRGSAAAVEAAGVQEVRIVVAGGYDPPEVRVRRGSPVRLVFDRQESAGCSEEVVIPEFGIRRFLAPHQETAVEFTPAEPGRYEFTCGMGMLRGRVVVGEG